MVVPLELENSHCLSAAAAVLLWGRIAAAAAAAATATSAEHAQYLLLNTVIWILWASVIWIRLSQWSQAAISLMLCWLKQGRIQFPQSSSTGKRLKSIKALVAFALKVMWYVLVPQSSIAIFIFVYLVSAHFNSALYKVFILFLLHTNNGLLFFCSMWRLKDAGTSQTALERPGRSRL